MGPIYVVEWFGDIPRLRRLSMSAHGTLDDALSRIKDVCGNTADDGYNLPDPEDDRIVVWRCEPGEPVTVAWHFSGWHWDHEAADLPGGPIDQGTLPDQDMNLYALAND